MCNTDHKLIACLFCFTDCDSNCKVCADKGVGKCDPGQCKDGYFYSAADDLCSKYGLVHGVVIRHITLRSLFMPFGN